MSVTYNPRLPTDKDWVRYQVGDSSGDPDSSLVQDEEIEAILAEEKNKYLAAARVGEVILSRNQGVSSKSVPGLSLSFGDSPQSSYRSHLDRLRSRGCELLMPKPRHFRIMGGRTLR